MDGASLKAAFVAALAAPFPALILTGIMGGAHTGDSIAFIVIPIAMLLTFVGLLVTALPLTLVFDLLFRQRHRAVALACLAVGLTISVFMFGLDDQSRWLFGLHTMFAALLYCGAYVFFCEGGEADA